MKPVQGVYTLSSLLAHYSFSAQTSLPDGRWVLAVAIPMVYGPWMRIRQAWEVFQGRAVALKWPEPGDLEAAFPSDDATQKPRRPRRKKLSTEWIVK